jgi:hypothetical protein
MISTSMFLRQKYSAQYVLPGETPRATVRRFAQQNKCRAPQTLQGMSFLVNSILPHVDIDKIMSSVKFRSDIIR